MKKPPAKKEPPISFIDGIKDWRYVAFTTGGENEPERSIVLYKQELITELVHNWRKLGYTRERGDLLINSSHYWRILSRTQIFCGPELPITEMSLEEKQFVKTGLPKHIEKFMRNYLKQMKIFHYEVTPFSHT